MSFQKRMGSVVNGARMGAMAVAALVLVAGCGGGGGAGPTAVPPAEAASASAAIGGQSPAVPPLTATVAEYSAWRTALATAAPAASAPDATAAAQFVSASVHAAVEELRVSLGATGNAAAAPPLMWAALNSLAAAATGGTLTEISSRFDVAPTPWTAAARTGQVTRQLWVDRGRPLRTDFLAATDAFGDPPRLAGWSAAEVGFGDGSDAGYLPLITALDGAGVSLLGFDHLTNIRLLSLDRLTLEAAWPAAGFNGVFERAPQDWVRLPMLRLAAGVTRHVGSDYTADVLPVGDLWVMSLRPASGTLSDFASTRLEPALAQAVEALLGDTAASTPPAPGDMVLPVGDLALSIRADDPLRRAGIGLAYDPVNADLHGLDGVGGTYVQGLSGGARLTLSTDGMSLRAAHAMAYTFSVLNLNFTGGFAGTTLVLGADGNQSFTAPPPPPCGEPDLRTFFLIVLDGRRQVVSLIAVQAPGDSVATARCP